jgi:phage terminase large subunit
MKLVESVTFERVDRFYDLTVPGAAHYAAHGVWHHNTGKTWGCLNYLDLLAWQFPGCQCVIARKTYTALIPSAIRTYERVIGLQSGNCPIKVHGGSKPEWYDYPNGSRIWVAGLDNPGKALSSERDFVYVNQAEELSLDDWETMTTRTTGRGSVAPYTRLFGDCNPAHPTHWIKTRPGLAIFESRHEDNPTLFRRVYSPGRTTTGTIVRYGITRQGRRSLAILDRLSGTRYQRLRLGRWVSAEGVVYDRWDAARNIIDRMPRGWQRWRKKRVIDFGYVNPAVCQWWCIDPDGGMICYRELYVKRWLVEDLVNGFRNPDDRNQILYPGIKTLSELDGGESAYEATICDHDAEDRATLERHLGCATVPAIKNVKAGIDAVAARIRPNGNGRRRLHFLRTAPVIADPECLSEKLPTSALQEIDAYVWKKRPATNVDKNAPDEPVKKDDHGMDAMRYVVADEDGIDNIVDEVVSEDPEYFGR